MTAHWSSWPIRAQDLCIIGPLWKVSRQQWSNSKTRFRISGRISSELLSYNSTENRIAIGVSGLTDWASFKQRDWCLFPMPFLPLSPFIKVDHKLDTKPVWSERYIATPTNPDNYSRGLTSLPVWPSASGLKPHCVSTVSSLQHIHHGWTEHCGGNKRDKQAAVLSTTARHP